MPDRPDEIGVVYVEGSKPLSVIAIINPTYEGQLDDPSWTQSPNGDAWGMVRVSHRGLPDMLGPAHLPRIIQLAETALTERYAAKS